MMEKKLREQLEEPFPQILTKTRPGSFGKPFSYVGSPHYIKRLNDLFEGGWNFEIIERWQDGDELVVRARLTAGGTIKEQFGSTDIKRKKENGEVVCIGDDWKAATTDALKKCCSLFGIGQELYTDFDYVEDGKFVEPKGTKPAESKPAEPKPTPATKPAEAPKASAETMGALKKAMAELRTKMTAEKADKWRDDTLANFKYNPKDLNEKQAAHLLEITNKMLKTTAK